MIFVLLLSLPPINSRNSDLGSHSRLLSRDDFSPFFPRRLASNCAYPRYIGSQQLILFFLQMRLIFHHGGIGTLGPTIAAFEGIHQTTGATDLIDVSSWGERGCEKSKNY